MIGTSDIFINDTLSGSWTETKGENLDFSTPINNTGLAVPTNGASGLWGGGGLKKTQHNPHILLEWKWYLSSPTDIKYYIFTVQTLTLSTSSTISLGGATYSLIIDPSSATATASFQKLQHGSGHNQNRVVKIASEQQIE
jgi:hypothetical protein